MANINRIKNAITQSWDDDTFKAVSLFLFVEDHIFFIRRSETMPSFRGHLAFVGGHRQEGEINPWETAKREYVEETSLPEDSLEFLGHLPDISTVSSRFISSVVAKTHLTKQEFINSIKSNGEWTYAFTVPFKYFLDESSWSYGVGHWKDKKRYVFFNSIDASIQNSTRSEVQTEMLWGATAKMVWSLVQLQKS